MRKVFCLLFFLLVSFLDVGYSQTGIGTTTPDPSAQLDVTSTEKGVLIPRMTEVQKNGISNPATGLLIYQTNGALEGFYYYDGSVWVSLSTPGPSPPFVGFSAKLQANIFSPVNQNLTGWIIPGDPFYTDPGFDPASGIFTVPVSGKYRLMATINYKISSTPGVSLGAGVDPGFRVVKSSTDPMLTGYLPVLEIVIGLDIYMRAILTTGQVVLAGDLELSAGDEIYLEYLQDGLDQDLNLDATWSVRKID